MDTNDIIKERTITHGDFSNVANVASGFKKTLRLGVNYKNFTDVQKECLDMILHKIARICSGDPNYVDHWRDIIGYTQLVVDRLNK